MAMGGGFDNDDEVMSEINMTPLVDVMLVLLIIFMVTMPVLTNAVKIELPQASSAPQDVKPEHVSLSIDAEGKFFWNQEELAFAELEKRLQAAAQQQPQPELHLSADKQSRYDPVAQALAAAQRAGMSKVGFVTEPRS